MENEKEYKKEVIVTNEFGLHARPTALLVEKASSFTSEIWICKDDITVNAKSIMGVLMLAAIQGTKLSLIAKGVDAKKAISTLAALIEDYFDE